MTLRPVLAAVLLAVAVCTAGCGGDEPGAAPAPSGPTPTSTSAPTSPTPSDQPTSRKPHHDPRPTDRPTTVKPSPGPDPEPVPFEGRRVLAISIDGLNPSALEQLGHDGAPNIWRLLDEGLGTRNARTELEQTVTLPNHTGMVTGRPIDPRLGGHGVTWNEEIPGRTVQGAAGERVESIFTSVHGAGGSTAVYAGKSKFELWEASWPDAVDVIRIDANLDALVSAAVADLVQQQRTFTFVHILEPDGTGHASGFMSSPYLDAVRRADAAVGRLLETVDQHVVVILTADHGGLGAGHGDAALPADYTIPFVIWGRGIEAGDLYDRSAALADPGTGRPTYADRQPVRNCDLADVATTVLALPSVPGSLCDANGEITPFD